MADIYDKVATTALADFHQQLASEITSSLTTGRVLDVGTGPGHLLVDIAAANPNLKLTGIDLSKKMLQIAKELMKNQGLPCSELVFNSNPDTSDVQLIHGDVRNLPFADNTFDLVVSTLSIHHWRDPVKGIQECLRVTAPGGQCWICDMRTDVPVKTLSTLVTGNALKKLLFGFIFKFHGLNSQHYQSDIVSSWLGGHADVKTEFHPAYLILKIKKKLSSNEKNEDSSKNELYSNSSELSA